MKTCVICTDLTPWSPHIDLTAAAPHTKPRVLNYIDWDADSWKSFDASSLMGGGPESAGEEGAKLPARAVVWAVCFRFGLNVAVMLKAAAATFLPLSDSGLFHTLSQTGTDRMH